jgi:hypothetical protein
MGTNERSDAPIDKGSNYDIESPTKSSPTNLMDEEGKEGKDGGIVGGVGLGESCSPNDANLYEGSKVEIT